MIIADLHYLEEERSNVIQMLADLDRRIDKVKKIIATGEQYGYPAETVEGDILAEMYDRESFLTENYDTIFSYSERCAWNRVADSVKESES